MENIVFAISLLKTENAESILLGNINFHHLWWGGIYIVAECQVKCLLKAIDNRGLKLATPPGIII